MEWAAGGTPERVGPEDRHELVVGKVRKDDIAARHAGIGKEDVEAAVAAQRVVHDGLDLSVVGGVEAASMDVDGGKGGLELAAVRLEVAVVKVAEVESPRTTLGKLVGGGAADAQGRVGAWRAIVSVGLCGGGGGGGGLYR